MGWKKALLHAGIAAGSASSGALAAGLADSRLDMPNLIIAGVAGLVALFASLSASYAAGEFDDVSGAPIAPAP